MGIIRAPENITARHDTTAFDCGNETLNNWLKKRALKNEKQGASRTFVVCDNQRVAGFYALASGSVERLKAPGPVARNMPDPVPVLVLGRLAVCMHYQNKKPGCALLRDALLRTLCVSAETGVKALLVHAISAPAKAFYTKYGFIPSPADPLTLFLPVTHIKAHL